MHGFVTVLTATVVLTLGQVAMAQLPIGSPTALGGMTPSLHAQPPWLGSDTFSYTVQSGPANGVALLGLSTTRVPVVSSGLTIELSLSPADLLSITTIPLDAQGRGRLDRPIAGVPNPSAFAGLLLYAQAAVADSANAALGATQALQLEVILRPLMFLVSESSMPRLADPFSNQVTVLPRNFTGIPTQARFINGGRDLILSTSSGIWQLDSLAPASGFTQWASGAFENLGWDAVRKRLICFAAGQLFIFNGDRAAASFGQGQLPIPWPAAMDLSADGTRGFMKNGANVELVDLEPTSANYLQVVQTTAIPPLGGVPNFEATSISSDGRIGTYTSVIVIGGLVERHRLDIASGQWIDHNAALAGTQALGNNSDPVIGGSDALIWQRDDSHGYIFDGFTSPRRIDRDLDNFGSHSISPTLITQTQASFPYAPRRLGLTSSGRFLVEEVAPLLGVQGTAEIFLIHLDTGIRVPWFQFADDGAYLTTAWR